MSSPLHGNPRRGPVGLWRRLVLTVRYLGWRVLLLRVVTFPLRFTPLRGRFTPARGTEPMWLRARAWYRRAGRPVCIVIASYRDAEEVARLVASIRRTVPDGLARIIVADDASGAEHLDALRAIPGIEVVAGEENRGFAHNVNRGIAAAAPTQDVVVLNSDMEAQEGWLACLQYATEQGESVGIVSGKLVYPDGRIQFAGTQRNLGHREWFDHRYRFKPADHGPAGVAGAVLAVTGACMYIRRAVLDDLGDFDERYPMAYEDVDLCLRAWQAGWRVLYFPAAELIHYESTSRGSNVGERERLSQTVFWERWGEFLDARPVRTAEGRLRVIYVTEDTGVGGGHRDIFEHLNRLAARGHEVALFTLGESPEWFELEVPVRSFDTYDELVSELAPLEAIKVATWWNTGQPVWQASVLHGIPVFFVQDIETSYYPDDQNTRHAVLDGYRPEFHYMTISSWNRDRLRELGLDAVLIPPGIDIDCFRPLPGVERHPAQVLALGRSNPLKNLPLTKAAWSALPEPRPELLMFGIEPELADEPGMRYLVRPSDAEVNLLFNECTVLVQTSTHEGFCLPPLEAMATGAAVVCTDAHGNRDFCRDGENCLMPDAERDAVASALTRVLGDPALRARLGEAGRRTAADYAWPKRIDALEEFLEDVARPRRVDLQSAIAVPEIRKRAR